MSKLNSGQLGRLKNLANLGRGRTDVRKVGEYALDDPSFGNCNHKFTFVRESDLADFLKGRIVTTARKMVLATAMQWLEGRKLPFTVGGAGLQDNAGSSSFIHRGDRSYCRGYEAAHFGIGTVKSGGRLISIRSAEQLILGRLDARSRGESTSKSSEALSTLVRYMLVADAATYWAPMFVNRTEGSLERLIQPAMASLIPMDLPRSSDHLEGQLNRVYSNTVQHLYDAYGNIIWSSAYNQDPQEVQEKGTLYRGSAADFNAAIKAQATNPGSQLHTAMSQAENSDRGYINEITQAADTAKK